MTIDEEIQYLKLSLSTLNTVFENIENIVSFVKQHDDGSEIIVKKINELEFDVKYRTKPELECDIILSCEICDYINLRTYELWVLNHNELYITAGNRKTFGDEYSVLNCDDFSDEFLDNERWFDSLMANKRIPTEEEYFQGTLLLKDLTLTYEDFVRVLCFLHEHKRYTPNIKNVCSTIYLESASFDIIDKIRAAITEQTGIIFKQKGEVDDFST